MFVTSLLCGLRADLWPFYVSLCFFCKRFKPLYIEKTVYIKTHKTEWMLRNNADAHISSLGYLWYPLQYPNLVESKLNCKSKSWLPTPYRALVILLTRRLNPALSMVSPAWTFLQADTPTLFSRLFSSHDLSAGYYPVLTDACILLCWWCKNTYVWTYEGSRITFLKNGLWTLRVDPNSF